MEPQNQSDENHVSVTDGVQGSPDSTNVSYTDMASSDLPPNIIFATSKTEISSSLLPHPDLMKGYNEVIPNGADRIMRLTEREQENSFEERRETREGNFKIAFEKLNYIRRGQIMGFSIALIMVAIATVFVFTNHESIAYFVFSVGAASLVGLFLNAKSNKSSKPPQPGGGA